MKKFITISLLIHLVGGILVYVYSGSENRFKDALDVFRNSVSEDLMKTPSYEKPLANKISSKKLKEKNQDKKPLKKTIPDISKKNTSKVKVVKKESIQQEEIPTEEALPELDVAQQEEIQNIPEIKSKENDFLDNSLPQAEVNGENFDVAQQEALPELDVDELGESAKELDVAQQEEIPTEEPISELDFDELGEEAISELEVDELGESSNELDVAQREEPFKEVEKIEPVVESSSEENLDEKSFEKEEMDSQNIAPVKLAQQEKPVVENERPLDEDEEDQLLEEEAQRADDLLGRQFEDVHTDPEKIKNIIKNDTTKTVDKSQISQKKVEAVEGSPKVKYPENARFNEQEGSVSLLYYINNDGLVDRIKMITSSGSSELDNEALRVLARQQYPPGKSGWYKHRVDFKLKNM